MVCFFSHTVREKISEILCIDCVQIYTFRFVTARLGIHLDQNAKVHFGQCSSCDVGPTWRMNEIELDTQIVKIQMGD